MAEFSIIVSDALPTQYQGSFHDFSLRLLGTAQKISIEDFFFKSGKKIEFSESQFVISMPGNGETVLLNLNLLLFAEFALALLAVDGHPKLAFAVVMKNGECIDCQQLPSSLSTFTPVKFASNVKEGGAAQWFHYCFLACKKNGPRMEVASHRYVRYSRFADPADALFDLCIALESLLNAQTEVSFRFSLCLVKVLRLTGAKAQATAELLGRLYNLRSKLAHGTPNSNKLVLQMHPELPTVRDVARKILVAYVLYLGDHSCKEWDDYLKSLIYG
jgi:hypothetical protein